MANQISNLYTDLNFLGRFFVNPLAKKYYGVGGESNIQEVFFLCEDKRFSWDVISEKIPEMPRGWYELSRLSPEERIEFVSTLWLDRLPYNPKAISAFTRFFSRLDDIAIVGVKRDFEYYAEMVYSFSDNRSFFRGFPPAGVEDVRLFKEENEFNFPYDYLSFLRLHNGFGKLSDIKVLPMEEVFFARQIVQEILNDPEHVTAWKNHVVEPDALVPFYEDMGLNSFQCFFKDWYPDSDMGNVYLSGVNYTISDTAKGNDALAFATFLEWLAFYLEGLNVTE